MKYKFCIILVLFLFYCNISSGQYVIDDPELDIDRKPLPPYSIRKLRTYEDFTPFELTDLSGKVWTNRKELDKPLLLLTGKWALRHDIRKWAHYLSMRYGSFCDIIWVFNPDSTKYANHKERNEKALRNYTIAVPVVIDSHAIIGRSLKIEYDIPTIIGITRRNTLGFVYESPLNKMAIDRIETLMFTKLFKY